MSRAFVCLLLSILILPACDPETRRIEDPAPVPAPAAKSAAPAEPQPATAPVAAEEPTSDSREARARAYLEQAREAAEQRHRKAMAHCESVAVDARDACIASAEEGLLAEMRAARVEHDAQMSQPE